jgi:CxxC-x17-CxxC domain-containing protein
MGNFNRDRSGGDRGGRSFGKKSFGGGDRGGFRGGDRREGGRSEMHAATCSECGNACEVPFRPTGARPIFCSNCFGKQKSQEGKSFGGERRERSFDRPRFENKRPDFRQAPAQENKAVEQMKQQLEIMNNKLERILNLVLAPGEKEKITFEDKTPAKPNMKKETTPAKEKTKEKSKDKNKEKKTEKIKEKKKKSKKA